MTSTNDGKEVKSNQTSGQKGKSYYIELYKSLETRLVEPGSGSQRTRAVCEAWRRVHSLCQHSAPSTHPHLLAWIQRHTSQTILQTDWRQSDNKEEQHAWLQEAIDAFIAECNKAITSRNAVTADWEKLLLERAQWFRTVLKDPWGHPVLKALVNSQGDELTDQEVLEWLKEEKDITFVTRLRQLAASRSCMDLALRLATAVMDRARATVDEPGVEQTDKPETTTKSQFVTILENEVGFTSEVWDFVKDIEFVLLYSESRSRCIDLAKQQPHSNAYQLVERLRNRLERSPRDKKVWKNAKEVATLIAQVVIARCMVVQTCTGDTRVALYGCARSLVRLLPADKLPTAAAALAAPAATARHLHTLALAVHTECKNERRSFVCELYVRAITAGMNELERLKIKTDKQSEARSAEKVLSTWFTQLGSLLSASARMSCECILTAFSVHPTPSMYEQVKIAPPLEPLHKDVQEPKPDTNSEFGSWATDSRTQTNLVKTSETLNLKYQKQTNVLSTAMFTEGEALGLEAELCQDLAVLISGPRVKTLSWDMDRESLLETCRTYMERTHGGTRALTTELKYLNLDPRSFQHLPEEDDDENDLYYGIEKGYEHLLETPEELWQNELSDDSEKTDTAHSTEECVIDIPKRKKKSKRSQCYIEEVDPLSMTEETNRTKLQERPHSKEGRRKNHDMKDGLFKDEYNQEKNKDKREKKKERKERKKKEKYETNKDNFMQNPEGNLSKLVGLKVCRVADDKCVTDRDYGSQGMSSINLECNNPKIIEDNFSIDDMKRSMYQYNELCLSKGVSSKEKTQKIPGKQKSQSLIKNTEHGIFSPYNPERRVSEEVKKSIKQFVEMKQNNKFTVEPIFRQHENYCNSLNVTKTLPPASVNDNRNYIKGRSQTPNLQHKGNLVMNREKQLSSLKDEVNYVLQNCNNQGNSIKQKFSNVTVETFIPSSLSNERNKFKIDNKKSVQIGVNPSTAVQHLVQNFKLHTPLNHLLSNTVKPSLLKKNESPSQCQFKEFLKQRSVNPTITKLPIRSTFDTPSQIQFQEFLRQQNSPPHTSPLNNTKDIIQKNSQDYPMSITTAHKKLHTSCNKERMKIEDSKQYPYVSLQNLTRQVSPNITDSGNQKQYHHFLKELMEATNAGAGNDTSEINQPGFDKDNSNQHRKADNALNTFSRLSYLHKNKQSDNRHRLTLDQSSHPQSMSMEELRTLDISHSKISNIQSKEVAVLKMDKTNPINENKKIGANSTINNQYPIVSNMLLSGFRYHGSDIVQNEINNVENRNVSVRTSNLSDKDQNDLLLLLQQKSKMNIQSNNDNMTGTNPKTNISVKSKIDDLSQSSHNLNLDLSRPETSRTDRPVIKTSNSNTSSTTSELKKVRTAKASSKNIKQISKANDVSSSDWESVMDALLAHKTPSRGPNALDIVLKKDSFEKRLANKTTENPKAVNSSNARINTVTECGGSKTSSIKKYYTHDFKQRQDKKITKVDTNMRVNRKMTPKIKEKQFSSFIQNGTDPFISGIPNSDFDLLGELMDDDLRKEIGELLDDDEVYGLGMSTPKTNSLMHNKNNPATSHKPQIIIDTRPNLNSENSTSKLDENIQSRWNGVFKTITSNQPQVICEKLTPPVTIQKSNCKIISDSQPNQSTKTITNIAEKKRSLFTANKCNSGNELIEVKMPKLQTCNFNILEPPKVVLAVPQPATKNVVLISNELVYKPLTLEVEQPEPQPQSQYAVNNYVKVNQLSSNYLAINQSSGSYVAVTQPSGGNVGVSQSSDSYMTVTQPSGGYMSGTQPSGGYVTVSQPSATYMGVTQPPGSYVDVHQTSRVTPHYPVIIDTAVTVPVIQRLPQNIPLVNNSPVDILVSEKLTKLKCTKLQFEATNLKTKEINTSEEPKIKSSYSNKDINISRNTSDKSLVRLKPTILEENVTVSSTDTELPISVPAPIVLTSIVNTLKPKVSTEIIRKDSESLLESLNSSSVEMNQPVPNKNLTISSKIIEATVTVPVPQVLTPTVSVYNPRVSTESIRKDSEPSRDFMDNSSIKVNPKVSEKNVTITSKVIESKDTVPVPLMLTPIVRLHKLNVSTESIRNDSELSRDFQDSSSVKVNPKEPENKVSVSPEVIEPTITVPVPLVLTPTVSIHKPRVSTESIRKDSEPSLDFLDSSSIPKVPVNPKVPEKNITISSTVIEAPVAESVLKPITSASKPSVPTVTIPKDSKPSDTTTSIDKSKQSDCVEKIFLSNKIAKIKESNEEEDEIKITICDHERIKQKRILLKNRLNHHYYCCSEPIALTYEPMYLQIKNDVLVSNLKSGEQSELSKDSKNEKNTITNLVRTNENKNIVENTFPEILIKAPNKNVDKTTLSELPCCRILLRSSNSLETPTHVSNSSSLKNSKVIVKPKSLQKVERKDKLKTKKLKKYKIASPMKNTDINSLDVLKNDLLNNEIAQNTINKVEEKSEVTYLPEEDLEDQIAPSVIKIPSKINNTRIVDNGGLNEQKQVTPISQVIEDTSSSSRDSNILHGNNPNSNTKTNTFKNKKCQQVPRFINSKDLTADKNYKNPNKANKRKKVHVGNVYSDITSNNVTTSTNSENLTNSSEGSKNKNFFEYKDKIIFEELPNVKNDPFIKYVRIKLPSGSTFKATISGKLNINIDSLFEEPSIKAMILKNINNNKKCTLNVKQLMVKSSENNCTDTKHAENGTVKCSKFTNPAYLSSRPKNIIAHTVITQVRDLSASVINETIDLISDDEENTVQIFKTEFGNFNSVSMKEDVFLKHQRKFSQKCVVKVDRCDFVQEILKLKLTKEVMTIKEKLPLRREKIADIIDIIDIDDSSNDSEKKEKFDLTSLNVKYDRKITKLTENVDVLKDMLLNDLGVKVGKDLGVGSIEKSNVNNVQKENHIDRDLSSIKAQPHTVKSKKCVLKLDKCDELLEKIKIQKNTCFVRLLRCDSLVRNTYPSNELSKFEFKNSEKIQTEGDIKMESVKDNQILHRSGSLSIVNDFSVMEEVKSDRSSPSLIENVEIPLILPNNFNIKTSFSNSSTTYNCNAEWFMTKLYLLNLHTQTCINSKNVYYFAENEKSQLDDKSTDCDSDVENNLLADQSFVSEEKFYKKGELYQVLSLVKIITNFFANNDSIIERLKTGQEGSKSVLYSSPLKRKYEEGVDRHRQKISKQENYNSCVASKGKEENLSQELLLNHKLNVYENCCFDPISDVKNCDENDVLAFNINNLTQDKVSNIENDQENNLLDSRKNKIDLNCHVVKKKHVEQKEKKLEKAKQIQQIKYTTQYKELNSKENIRDINLSPVAVEASESIFKHDIIDDMCQHIPVTKTNTEKVSKDRDIDLIQKTLKNEHKCMVNIEKSSEHDLDNGISDPKVISKLQDNSRNVNQPENEELESNEMNRTKESFKLSTIEVFSDDSINTGKSYSNCSDILRYANTHHNRHSGYELDVGPENNLVEVNIPLNEVEKTEIGALENALAISSPLLSDVDKNCQHRTSNINEKHNLQSIESEKLDGKAVLAVRITQEDINEVHKFTKKHKFDEDMMKKTYIEKVRCSKNEIDNLNVTSDKHKASNEVKVTLNYDGDTKCNVTIGINRSPLAFPRAESKESIEKVKTKASIDNTLQDNVTLFYNGDSLKGSIYENPIVGKCYLFCDNVCNDNSLNVIQALKSKIFEDRHKDEKIENTETKNTKFNVIIPKFTYSRQRIKNQNIANHNAIEDGLKGKSLKRKIDFCDNKLNKRYRKGKNIDYPKLTNTSMSNTSYGKEYNRLFNYWSSIKFSFTRPFHKEYIDVSSTLKCWPITEMKMDVPKLAGNERILYLDNSFTEKVSSDPLKQTLAEEILSEYVEPQSSCDEINENNFSMGFGERSDRVIQNSGDGDNISKFSAATLSDVKQSQPFLVFEDNKRDDRSKEFYKSKKEQMEINKRYFSCIQLRDKVRSFFRKTTLDLHHSWLEENIKNKNRTLEHCGENKDLFPYDVFSLDFIEPAPIESTVHVVQVGQLPVSAAAQNPVTCDPRVTQVTDASPSQCSAENSPHEDLHPIKTEYTELTTANLSLPLVQECERHIESQESSKMSSNENENIPVKIEVSSGDENSASEGLSQIQDERNKCNNESDDLQSLVNKHINNIEYSFDSNDNNTLEGQIKPEIKFEPVEIHNSGMITQQKEQNGSTEKTDQIAHAMNAAGITTSPEPIIPENTTTQTLVNMFSQKICQEVPGSTQQNNFAKASINTMTLQQALAQILPPPLNQTNSQETNQMISNSPVASQVLHIVQGKNTNGSQITVVDNTQNSVISNSGTPVLHIVHNKGANSTTNSTTLQHGNTYSGLSLVDAGLQQGNNQLLHIVNAGTQKNNATGQILKRVNLLTNLTNMQGSNDQKMVQFVCKSADGKSIQLNAPHQRSMVLRLQPFESPGIQSNLKSSESQDLSPPSTNGSALNKESNNSQHEIKSRSVYEENYAKFIQNSSNKTIIEKSTILPKFNQAFGKQVYQDANQKPNETSTSSSHLSSDTENECQSSENTLNLDHIGQLNGPPLLLRKSPAQTSQTQSNIVHQIKQTIAPMMHGGVIYTRQIPVNIGGGQTINLITVPSTEYVDDSNQKHHGDLKFVNHGEIESPIIKIVPQNQSTDMKFEESNNHQTSSTNENAQNTVPQNQPVLTQMRIKLPMLSKTPQMVSGARVGRPSFFQIQRNVIGGANQPVYQQLVLTAAPPFGPHTIRLPHVQTRQVKIATENQASESHMSSSTLEQLREFDMVLEQVKERSTVQPNCTDKFSKLTTSSDTNDSTCVTSTVTESTQQILYSIGANQSLNVAYVNRKPNSTATSSTAFIRCSDSSGVSESPSSARVQIPHTVTSETTSNDASTQQNQPKAAKVGSKSKSRPKSSSHPPNSLKINSVPPKTSTQKPLEDEQTTQRILYILAEYKEKVEKSPDKDKPAPRRRTNPPSNPSGSSKRKKSSSSSRRHAARDVSPIHAEDNCRTMGSEDSSCGTSQGDCTESCLESHSPQDSPRKVVRKLTFENEISATTQPRTQQQRNVIVDGQTITVARGTSGKPTTAVLMPANYILPVSMVKGGQQIAIVTNRGPKLLTVAGGEGGTNALLLQRLIGPAGLKPVLTRPGVRHVRLPTAALHNLQAFNLATATTVHSQDSAASPSPVPTPSELIETRANSSTWGDSESQDVKPDRGSSPEGSEPWLLTADPNDYSYEETVRTENMDRTVLVVQKKYAHRQRRLAHVSAAALRHKYAMLEHELRLQGSGFLQKSLSEECEDLGVDSPSASELFPEAELLFSSSPAHEAQQQSQTPQPTVLNQAGVPQPDIDDQMTADHLQHEVHGNQEDLGVTLGLDEGIVTVSEDGMQATIAVDQEEFARSHPNTTFHSEPTEEGEVQPFTITALKDRQITSTIFHAGRAPATVLVTAPQTTVISQATQENVQNDVKYANIDHIINAPSTHRNLNLSSVLVKDQGGLTKFDNILTDSREIHLSNTASAIIHSTGNATQVITRVCYEDDKRATRYVMDESDGVIAGDDAKMIGEDSSRDATQESIADVDEGNSSPERHTELFWESNSASERSESRRRLDFSSDSEKCCKSPFEETNSTDSSGVGTHMRLDSVIKEARRIDRAGSGSSDDHHPPLRTYPAKRYLNQQGTVERSLSGKTRAGFQEERSESHEIRRRASGRGVVKRGCHCCNGSPAPPRPKKPKKKPTIDFNSN